MKFYLVYKNHGLYDPVLDDYDPIYEAIDQDSDQPSRPTEVDPNADICPELTDLLKPIHPYTTDPNSIAQCNLDGLTDTLKDNPGQNAPDILDGLTNFSRSLTASPYVGQAKPFRPFSTEPVDVPPLEDPLILNPDYHDIFKEFGIEDFMPTTKFKLPISEQYDPDGKRQKKDQKISTDHLKVESLELETVKTVAEITEDRTVREDRMSSEFAIKEDSTKLIKDIASTELVTHESIEMKSKDVSLEETKETVEQTATIIVEESLEKAVAVAEEIRREIDVELSDSENTKVDSKIQLSKMKCENVESVQAVEEVTKLVSLIDKAADQIIQQNESVGIVEEQSSKAKSQKEFIESDVQTKVSKQKDTDIHETHVQSVTEEHKARMKETVKSSEVKTDSKTTSQILREQRAYTIGLQTIPNIRGTVHSSYHFNLLLKTFFIHLTDVMVALSRFILTEPILNENQQTQQKEEVKKVVTETVERDTAQMEAKAEMVAKQDTCVKKVAQERAQEIKFDRKEESSFKSIEQLDSNVESRVNQQIYDDYYENLELEELEERRKLSGSRMAQLVERKSEELTNKMDAVITEFQTKTGIEETMDDRRSRSRSRQEEVIQQSAPALGLLSQVDAKLITEAKSSKKTIEMQESSQSREGNNMYIAIVESHVYTNKDAILDEQVQEFKESSVVTAADKVNTSVEASEALKTEKVILENVDLNKKETKAVVKEHTAIMDEVIFKHDEKFESKITEEKVKQATVMTSKMIPMKKPMEEKKEVEFKKSVFPKQATVMATKMMPSKKEVVMEEKKESFEQKTLTEKRATVMTSKMVPTAKPVIKEEKKEEIKKELTSILKKPTVMATKMIPAPKPVVLEQKQIDQETSVSKTATIMTAKMVPIKKVIDKIEVTKEVETIIPQVPKQPTVMSSKMVPMKKAIVIEEKQESCEQEISESHTKKATVMTAKMVPAKKPYVVEEAEEKVLTLQIKKPSIMTSKMVPKKAAFKAVTQETTAFKEELTTQSFQTSEMFKSEIKCQALKEDIVTAVAVEETTQFEEEVTLKLADTSKTEITTIEQQSSKIEDTQVKTIDKADKLSIKTDISSDVPSAPMTPMTPIEPPTPMTDEYIFKLEIPLPKRSGNPIPRDCTPTPEDEDPDIVKRKFLPYIDTKIEDEIKYDPPLRSPPSSQPTSPVYKKPGLRGGADEPRHNKEEILEIERKSSLLATAIDQTIKSIEEYKEEVGIKHNSNSTQATDNKHTKTNKIVSELETNGYAKVVEPKVFNHSTEHNEEIGKKENATPFVEDKNTNGTEVPVNNETNGVIYNGYAKVVETKVYNNMDSVNQVANGTNMTSVANLSEGTAVKVPEVVIKNGTDNERPLEGYRPVNFNPDDLQQVIQAQRDTRMASIPILSPSQEREMYKSQSGELIGTVQGIVDGLEEAVVEPELAKEMGKPGITEEKIAELISGEAEMLREAHVMGLSRVLASHMSRPDDCSVDFNKIKPLVDSLKDSEVLKALNEEMMKKVKEEKKKENKKWTTFLQKPKRPVPKMRYGYYGFVDQENEEVQEPYKVKIVKQPKPKVAPDYKDPEEFNTGLLPWEERALREPTPPPVEPEDPILIPEEAPEILEAVDPLPESEVPDLEDSGIPLPPKEKTPPPEEHLEEQAFLIEDLDLDAIVEETDKIVAENLVEEMDHNNFAEQLMMTVQNMVDPAAPLEQQLSQMRAQLAALAQLPCVIQQSLEMVTKQLGQLTQLETQTQQQALQPTETEAAPVEEQQPIIEESGEKVEIQEVMENQDTETVPEEKKPETVEGTEKMKEVMTEEQIRDEKMKKDQIEEQRLEHESRQVKQHPTPRVGKPKPVFGPLAPEPRPLVLPGGRKWRGPKDAYNEQFYADTLAAQAEILQGKTKGINFMKWEKPPVSLDHLQSSETFKLIHNMEQAPLRRVDMLTPVVAEADYREKCRSMTPLPHQVQP